MKGLLIGLADKPAKKEESEGEDSPKLLAAKALLKAIKGGSASAVAEAFGAMMEECDMEGDTEESEEPAEDEELDD